MPFVGRSTELATWSRLRDQARAGEGSLWVITGVPGIGKTSLVKTVARDAREAGWTVLSAWGNPAAGTDPAWSTLTQWFARLAGKTADGEEPFDGPGRAIQRAVSGKMFAPESLSISLAWVIESLSEHAPVLLVIDDAHWADDASLQVLASTATQLIEFPVVIVVTARTHQEPEAFSALLDRPTTVTTEVASLQPSDIGEWLGEASIDIDAPTLSSIVAVTGGVPIMIAYLADHPEELESIQGTSPTSPENPRPDELLALVRQHIERTPDVLPLLAACAILDSYARIDHIAAILEQSPAATAASLRAAIDQDLIEFLDGEYRPAHPLLAEAALQENDLAQDLYSRAAIHLRDQASIEQIGAWLLATKVGVDGRALPLFIEAIRRALEFGLVTTAHELVKRALLEPADDDALATELLVLEGRANFQAGDLAAAVTAWQSASTLAGPALRLDIAMETGDACYSSGQFDEAREAYLQSLAVLEDPSVELAISHRRLAIARLAAVGWLVGEGSRLGSAELESVLAEDPANDGFGERALLSHAALELTLVGQDAARAARLARRAAADLKILSEDSLDGPILSMLTGALNGAECDGDAISLMTEALRRAKLSGSVMAFGTMSYCRAFVQMNRGRLRRARMDAEAALRAHREHGWAAYLSAAQMVAVRVYLAKGDTESAQRIAADVDLTAPSLQATPLMYMMALQTVGMVAQANQNHEQAVELLSPAAEIADDMCPAPPYSLPALVLIESAVAANRSELAVDVAEQSIARARAFGAPRQLGRALVYGSAAFDDEVAIPLLREAVHLLERHEGRYEYAEGMSVLARRISSLLGDKGRDEATRLARRAAIEADRIGAQPTANRARDMLTRLGARNVAPASDLPAALTASELRVCELAAKGLSNRQIAAELFVTVKAVEWHLWRAYPKLHIKSRKELPPLLARLAAD